MQTLLPDPVAPAISRWGMFERSSTSGLPGGVPSEADGEGLPVREVRVLLEEVPKHHGFAGQVRAPRPRPCCGPGIGATIRTLGAFSSIARSSASAVTRLSRTPVAIAIS